MKYWVSSLSPEYVWLFGISSSWRQQCLLNVITNYREIPKTTKGKKLKYSKSGGQAVESQLQRSFKKETCQAELPEGVNSMEQLWMKPVEFLYTFKIELVWPVCRMGRRAYCRSITTLWNTHVLWGKSSLNPHRCRYSTPWLIKPNYKKGKILV